MLAYVLLTSYTDRSMMVVLISIQSQTLLQKSVTFIYIKAADFFVRCVSPEHTQNWQILLAR